MAGEFDERYEVDMDNTEATPNFPFSGCSMKEIQQFFIRQPRPPEVHNFVLDWAYGDITSDTEMSPDSSTSLDLPNILRAKQK